MPIVIFKSEDAAEKFRWLFEPMGYKLCCAGGYYNAWIFEFRIDNPMQL